MSDTRRQKLMRRAAEAFFAAHTVVSAIISPDLHIENASKNFATLFGTDDTHVEGVPVTDLLYEFVGAEDRLRAMLAGEEASYRLHRASRRTAAGELRYLDLMVEPLSREQPAEGLLLLVEDVTSMSELQQQLVQERNELRLLRQKLDWANKELFRLNEMKSLFLSMAAHDLRAPLTSVFGYADLLLNENNVSPALREEALQSIREQADLMHHLINDVLNLDQVERGQVVINPKTFSLNEAVEDVVAGLKLIISNKGIALNLDLPEPALQLWVDPGKTMQILYNVLYNAVKYVPENGSISVHAGQEDGFAVIEVSNSGEGLTEQQMKELFNLYYRTDTARQSNRSGIGLGLFIVKMLVEAQQGQVDVRSDRGRSTTFSVRLPLTENAQ